jgi:hypothetical protein
VWELRGRHREDALAGLEGVITPCGG